MITARELSEALQKVVKQRDEAREAVAEAINDVSCLMDHHQPAAVGRMMKKYEWLKILLEKKVGKYYVEQCERDAEAEEQVELQGPRRDRT